MALSQVCAAAPQLGSARLVTARVVMSEDYVYRQLRLPSVGWRGLCSLRAPASRGCAFYVDCDSSFWNIEPGTGLCLRHFPGSHGCVVLSAPGDAEALTAGTDLVQVFESSGDGSLTHPGVLKDRVASPGGMAPAPALDADFVSDSLRAKTKPPFACDHGSSAGWRLNATATLICLRSAVCIGNVTCHCCRCCCLCCLCCSCELLTTDKDREPVAVATKRLDGSRSSDCTHAVGVDTSVI